MQSSALPRIKLKVGRKRTTTAFSKQEVDYFTTGDCWRLALKIQELFGYPAVAVSTAIYKKEWGANLSWVHVVNQVEEDKFIDILGLQSKEEVEGAWSFHLATMGHEPMLRKLTSENLHSMFDHVKPKYENCYTLNDIAVKVVKTYLG